MTLDNCIKMYEIWASDERISSDIREEHEQIAKWLKDYKRLLEQEPCEDAVSRQAVLEIAKSSKSNWIDNSVLFKRVNKLPPVQPMIPKGKWVDGICNREYHTVCNCMDASAETI